MGGLLCLLIMILLTGISGHSALASGMEGRPDPDRSASNWTEKFALDFEALTYTRLQRPKEWLLNRNNERQIKRTSLQVDLRPDFSFEARPITLIFRPRWNLRYEKCQDGTCSGAEDLEESAYVNEWLARIKPLEGLFLSYGRENLQWGPSFLLSPSNPFYTENGRDQPKQEVAGADYFRTVWAPSRNWSGSLIVNTGKGRKDHLPRDDFRPIYAVKLDYLAGAGFGSLVLSKEETADPRFGFYGGWNLSDATLLYAEGSYAEESELLAGASYTFFNGTMLSLEYFFNGAGNSDDSLLEMLLAGNIPDTRQPLFRKHYLMVQAHYRDMLKEWETLFRGTYNLDDDSAAWLGHVEYGLNDYLKVYANGTYFTGKGDDEFGLIFDYRVEAGLQFIF